MSKHADEIWIWRTGYHEPRIGTKQFGPDDPHYLLATPVREAASELLTAAKVLLLQIENLFDPSEFASAVAMDIEEVIEEAKAAIAKAEPQP